MLQTRKIALSTLFGVLYFVYRQGTLFFLPPPLPDLLLLPVLIVLGLSFLVVGAGGATYSAAIAGVLLSFFEPSFLPFTILLALLLGFTIDVFSSLIKVRGSDDIKTRRFVIALSLSSTVTGLIAFYTTLTANVVPYQFEIDATIIADGIISGAVSGFIVTMVWRKYMSNWISGVALTKS